MKSFVRISVSLGIVVVYSAQIAFGSMAEATFWRERQRPVTVLSSRFPAAHRVSLEGAGQAFGKLSPALTSLLQAIPAASGSVRDVYDSNDERSGAVVLLQDVHLNGEAQSNIAAVLQSLIDQRKIAQVGVEGAFGPFEFGPFRSFPNKRLTENIAKAFLDARMMAGPSFVGITSSVEPPSFVGVDDKRHYRANVEAYVGTRALKPKVDVQLNTIRVELEANKQKILSAPLLAFDNLRSSYANKTIGMGAYVEQLSRYGIEPDLAVRQFLEAYEMETKLDFKQVEVERKAVIERVAAVLTQVELADLTTQSLAYRMGHLRFGAYFGALRDLCARKKIVLRKYPAFENYVRYVLLSDSIKADSLFAGVARLERGVATQLIKTDAEKVVMSMSEQLMLTGKLVEFSLTPAEWGEYKGQKLENGKWKLDQGAINKNSSIQFLISNLNSLNLSPFERFYFEADARSRFMTEKLLGSPAVGARVLVAGGFHTPEIAERLRQRKISYVVVTPKITKLDDSTGTSYLSVFAREKTPLDQIFAGEKLYLAPHEAAIGNHVAADAYVAVEQHALNSDKKSGWFRYPGATRQIAWRVGAIGETVVAGPNETILPTQQGLPQVAVSPDKRLFSGLADLLGLIVYLGVFNFWTLSYLVLKGWSLAPFPMFFVSLAVVCGYFESMRRLEKMRRNVDSPEIATKALSIVQQAASRDEWLAAGQELIDGVEWVDTPNKVWQGGKSVRQTESGVDRRVLFHRKFGSLSICTYLLVRRSIGFAFDQIIGENAKPQTSLEAHLKYLFWELWSDYQTIKRAHLYKSKFVTLYILFHTLHMGSLSLVALFSTVIGHVAIEGFSSLSRAAAYVSKLLKLMFFQNVVVSKQIFDSQISEGPWLTMRLFKVGGVFAILLFLSPVHWEMWTVASNPSVFTVFSVGVYFLIIKAVSYFRSSLFFLKELVDLQLASDSHAYTTLVLDVFKRNKIRRQIWQTIPGTTRIPSVGEVQVQSGRSWAAGFNALRNGDYLPAIKLLGETHSMAVGDLMDPRLQTAFTDNLSHEGAISEDDVRLLADYIAVGVPIITGEIKPGPVGDKLSGPTVLYLNEKLTRRQLLLVAVQAGLGSSIWIEATTPELKKYYDELHVRSLLGLPVSVGSPVWITVSRGVAVCNFVEQFGANPHVIVTPSNYAQVVAADRSQLHRLVLENLLSTIEKLQIGDMQTIARQLLSAA